MSALFAAAVDDMPAGMSPRGSKLAGHVIELILTLREIGLYVRHESAPTVPDMRVSLLACRNHAHCCGRPWTVWCSRLAGDLPEGVTLRL